MSAEMVGDLVARALAGEVRSLARLLTLLEGPWDADVAAAMRALTPHAGQAHVVGVTGPPGVGKSTLVDRLVGALRSSSGLWALGSGLERGQTADLDHRGSPPDPVRSPEPRAQSPELPKVAVLAFDPSSPFTGGALLGDRIRMGEWAADPGVFIRSVANRARAGGLSRTAARLVTALDAAGYGHILVETVGAGQSEVEVSGLADTVVVVLAPGFGDEVQALKAGMLETADLFVVNKADLPGADRVVASLREITEGTTPLAVSATTGLGLAELTEALCTREQGGSGRQERRRAHRLVLMEEAVREHFWRRFRHRNTEALAAMAERVAAGEVDPESAAERLLEGDLNDG